MPLREHGIEPWGNLSGAQKDARYQGVVHMADRILELVPAKLVGQACTEIIRVAEVEADAHANAALADETARTVAMESAPFKKCGDLAGGQGFDLVRFVGYHDTYLCLLSDRKSGLWMVVQWDHIRNNFFARNSFSSYNNATDAYEERKAL